MWLEVMLGVVRGDAGRGMRCWAEGSMLGMWSVDWLLPSF